MKNEPLSTSNTVFFSTANDSYIFYSATSLLSIRRFLPDAQLYIISRQLSQKNKKFLNKHGINYIEIDLTYLFFQSWDYSTECYYLFAGPKLFNNLGFKYSVYLDSDVFCLKNPLENCPPINDIGGIEIDTYDKIFSSEKIDYSRKFNIPIKAFSGHKINSGVIYMNNSVLTKQKPLETCGELYYKTWEIGLPLKDDNSLFALFQLVKRNNLKPVILNNHYHYIPHHKGFNIDPDTIFFHFSFDKPWKYHPYSHENEKQNIFNNYTKEWRKISRHTSFCYWLKTLSFFVKIKPIPKKINKCFRQIPFTLKRVRYPIIKKRANLKKPPINLFWWEPPHIKNFGDVVSPNIILNIFGREVNWTPIESCDLIATGSILEVAEQTKRKTNFYVWGSGFIRENSSDKNLDKIIFTAVRGEKTLSRIKQKVPLGDPGLLINSTYCLKRKRHSKKIGVVIHYADMQTPIAKKFCEDPRFEVITPLDNPKNVAEKIANCGLILSSSLHGLIFADSLSIPNIHIKIADNLAGGIYKFLDYYSGIGKPYRSADIEKIFDNNYLQELKNTYKPVSRLTKIQRRLIKAFPFN